LVYLKEYEKAIIYADKVLKINSQYAEAYFLKGLIFKEIGNIDRAISSFQTAVEQNPELYEAYMQLGLLTESTNKKLAMEYYENALPVDTNSSEARYAKAMTLQTQSDLEKAKEEYREIIKRDPQYDEAIYNLGYIYFQQDSLDKAKRHFEMATKVNPTYADAYYMLGLCEETANNTKGARLYYNQVLGINASHELALKALKRTGNAN
jgi:tetratricopeptide (TPR) repeat protein